MSFGGLILTNEGRNAIAAALSDKTPLRFTHIQLGDGVYNGSYSAKTALTNKIMEIPVSRVARMQNEVLIECDWNSKQAPEPFYLREIGIIGNGVLCYYDNARSGDAEYIDPAAENVKQEKRFRFNVYINDETHITVYIQSGLYALSEDLQAHKEDQDIHVTADKQDKWDGADTKVDQEILRAKAAEQQISDTVAANKTAAEQAVSSKIPYNINIPKNADLNDITEPGFYWGEASSNSPVNGRNYSLRVEKIDDNNVLQEISCGMPYTGDGEINSNRIDQLVRVCCNGEWNQWKMVYNSSRDLPFPTLEELGGVSKDSISVRIGKDTSVGSSSVCLGWNALTDSYAIAIGNGAKANGLRSVSVSMAAKSYGSGSIAIGASAKAGADTLTKGTRSKSVSIGDTSKATGNSATAVGAVAKAEYDNSTAMGTSAIAGSDGTSLGANSNAGNNGIAIGSGAISNDFGIAVGMSTYANGSNAVAVGYGSRAERDGATAVGGEAKSYGVNSTAIGAKANVSSSDNNVIQLGSEISSLRCGVALSVTSDERDKTDFCFLNKEKALKFINGLDPVSFVKNPRSYYVKDDKDLTEDERKTYNQYGYKPYDREAHKLGTKKGTRRRVGVSAQQTIDALKRVYGTADVANIVNDNLYDVEDAPEGVENAYTVTYESFVPFLIAALQEVTDKLLKLEEKYATLEARVRRLEGVVPK